MSFKHARKTQVTKRTESLTWNPVLNVNVIKVLSHGNITFLAQKTPMSGHQKTPLSQLFSVDDCYIF